MHSDSADENAGTTMPASYERNPKRFQTSQNAGTSHCNGSADDGDWRGKFRTRTVTTHIRLRQFHAGTALRGSMYRICAHEARINVSCPLRKRCERTPPVPRPFVGYISNGVTFAEPFSVPGSASESPATVNTTAPDAENRPLSPSS